MECCSRMSIIQVYVELVNYVNKLSTSDRIMFVWTVPSENDRGLILKINCFEAHKPIILKCDK